jgi:hypothetical protein
MQENNVFYVCCMWLTGWNRVAEWKVDIHTWNYCTQKWCKIIKFKNIEMKIFVAFNFANSNSNCFSIYTIFQYLFHYVQGRCIHSWQTSFCWIVMVRCVFWDITLCNWMEVSRRFGGTYYFHLWDWRVSQARNHQDKQMPCVLLKYRLTFIRLHVFLSQKT